MADEEGYTYDIIPKLNAQKVCLINSLTEGCASSEAELKKLNWSPLNENVYLEGEQAGVILPSGVGIFGIESPVTVAARGGHKASQTAPCNYDPTQPDTLFTCGDHAIIALEGFPKKE